MNESAFSQEYLKQYAGDLTQDQYVSGEFFSFADSLCETDRARLYSEIKSNAKSNGWATYKEFDEFVKAHKKDIARQEAEKKKAAIDEQRKKNGTLLDPLGKASLEEGFIGISDLIGSTPNYGKYYCSDKGVFYILGTGETVVKVCSHPLFPTKRYVNIETGNELLDISYKIDGIWKTARLIDRKIICQKSLIPELSTYGMDITSENAKDIVSYLAEVDNLNRQIIPKEETISRLGWVDDRGFSPYIKGVIYDSRGRFADVFSSVREKGCYDTWKQTAAEVLNSKSYIPARLVLAASVASILLRWTCNQPFFVHLWQPMSGSGKTVAAMLAASVWGDPESGQFMRSLNATAVAFEQLDSFCNHLPLICDELQAKKDKKDEMEHIIYTHGEGTGKARGTKDGGLREQTRWMNIAITTGEQPLSFTNREGAINRVISIESVGQVIPGSKQHMGEIADILRDNYGFAGKMIVEQLQRVPAFADTIKDMYREKASELVMYVTGKQANYAATILVGDAVLNSILFGPGSMEYALSAKDISPYLVTSSMIDINCQIRSWLCGFVASESAYFIQADAMPSEMIRTRIHGKKEEDGSVLFFYERFKEELEKHEWALSSFMRWCNERKLIKTNYTESSRHWYVERTINQIGYVKVIHFLPSMFIDEGYQTDMGTVVNIDHPF